MCREMKTKWNVNTIVGKMSGLLGTYAGFLISFFTGSFDPIVIF